MSDQEFLFSLELSDEARFEAMLNEVAAAVCNYAGCDGDRLTAATATLRDALRAARDAGGRCVVRFQAQRGELQIAVSSAGRAEWRTTLPLPRQ